MDFSESDVSSSNSNEKKAGLVGMKNLVFYELDLGFSHTLSLSYNIYRIESCLEEMELFGGGIKSLFDSCSWGC